MSDLKPPFEPRHYTRAERLQILADARAIGAQLLAKLEQLAAYEDDDASARGANGVD